MIHNHALHLGRGQVHTLPILSHLPIRLFIQYPKRNLRNGRIFLYFNVVKVGSVNVFILIL